jgi:hypothetical protein
VPEVEALTPVGAGREVAFARAVPVPVVVRKADAEAIAPRNATRTAKATSRLDRKAGGFLGLGWGAARRGVRTGRSAG